MEKPPGKPVVVWDLPTRLFHWLLVLLLVVSFVTGKAGGGWLKWHFWSGYAILALVLFRIVWGFVGSTTARFAHFVRGPAAGIAYLRDLFGRSTRIDIGHNPVGGWMVLLLLLAVLVQAVTGLFTTDDIDVVGPFNEAINSKLADRLSTIHRLWINLLLLLAAIHVLASLFYYVVKKQNLVLPMITGRKHLGTGELPRLVMGSSALALAILALCGLGVYLLVRLGS